MQAHTVIVLMTLTFFPVAVPDGDVPTVRVLDAVSAAVEAVVENSGCGYVCDPGCTYMDQHMAYAEEGGRMDAGNTAPHGCTSSHECFDDHACEPEEQDAEEDLVQLEYQLRELSVEDLAVLVARHPGLGFNEERAAVQLLGGCREEVVLSIALSDARATALSQQLIFSS